MVRARSSFFTGFRRSEPVKQIFFLQESNKYNVRGDLPLRKGLDLRVLTHSLSPEESISATFLPPKFGYVMKIPIDWGEVYVGGRISVLTE